MSSTANSTLSTSTDSSDSHIHYPWPIAFNDGPLPSSAAYPSLPFHTNHAALAAHPRPRPFEQTWFDADLFQSLSPPRFSLSPLPLTSNVNSLWLPHTTAASALHHSDESDSTNSPTSPSSSPPPLPPATESELIATALYAFPAPPPPPPPPSSLPPAALPTSRKRVKADDEERVARAERKRRRHRAIDLARRQRETTAVQRINQLLTTPSTNRHTTNDDTAIASSDERRDKVTILEQAVQQLAGLQQLVAQLTHQNNSQHDQLHAVRFQMRQTQNALTHIDDETRSHSIYSSAFLSSTLSLFLVSVGTGLVLDANARLFQSTGWQRHHVIGRLLTAPFDSLIHRNSSHSERERRQCQRLLVENEQKQMVPSRSVQQYESGRQAIVDVSSGAREQVHSVWRLYIRDGRLCELPGTCWGGEVEEVEEEGGGGEVRRYRRPKHIIFAFSFSEAVMVD